MGSRALRGLRWSESGEECCGYGLGEQETQTPIRHYVTLLQHDVKVIGTFLRHFCRPYVSGGGGDGRTLLRVFESSRVDASKPATVQGN